jgi:hypothetical protein
MDINKLLSFRPITLNEAKSPDPEDIVNTINGLKPSEIKGYSDTLPEDKDNDGTEDDDNDVTDQNNNDQENTQDNDENTQHKNNNDNQESITDDMPEPETNIDDQYNFDDGDPQRSDIPDFKILTTLTDKEYKLNNLKCMKQFNDLYENVESMLNNNIINITTKNSRQQQIISIVSSNLKSMLVDLDYYIRLRFGDSYEENTIAYLTFLKRFKIAAQIIKLVISEDVSSDE